MYLDFDDRPDTPRLPSALSRLERALLAAVIYLLFVVAYLVTPDSVWQRVQQVPLVPSQPVRYVRIEPNLDRLAKPKPVAPESDLDRRATTPEPVPKPENDAPKSVGNSPERVTAPPPGESPSPSEASPNTPTPNTTAKVSPNPADAKPRPSFDVAGALRSVGRILQNEQMDNPQGVAIGAHGRIDRRGLLEGGERHTELSFAQGRDALLVR